MPEPKTANPRPAPGLAWAVETHGIRLVDHARGHGRFIAYPEAALWDLLTRRRSRETLTRQMAAVCGRELSETEQWIETLLDSWLDQGLLEKA